MGVGELGAEALEGHSTDTLLQGVAMSFSTGTFKGWVFDEDVEASDKNLSGKVL